MLRKTIQYSIIVIILIGLCIGAYLYWSHSKLYPSTDDAYVQANVVHIAPQVSGKVSEVLVSNHQRVTQGQPLFNIDPTPFKIALQKAEANVVNATKQMDAMQESVTNAKAQVAERQAQLINTQQQTERTLKLADKKFVSQSEKDIAISNLNVAKAALNAAQSQLDEEQQRLGAAKASIKVASTQLDQAKLNLQYTRLYAPANGYLMLMTLRKGSEVTAYEQVFSLIEDQQWWINANFKETDLNRIKPGQKATINLDIYPKHTFQGIVQSISDGSGAEFSLLPPENATGNWVKVTQRFPVRVNISDLNSNYPLRVGASATVTINTK